MQVEMCFKVAKEKLYKYVGLQNGGDCWAANAYGMYGKVDDSECKVICK